MKEKIYGMDGLKLIFLSLIILHHFGLMNSILMRGYIGFEIFFIISGFFVSDTCMP